MLLTAARASGLVMATSAGRSFGPMKSNSSLISGFQFESGSRAGHAWFVSGSGIFAPHLQVGNDGGFAASFLDFVNVAGDDAAFGAVEEGAFLGDGALFVGFEAGLIEVAPAEGVAGFDDFVEAFAFAFAVDDAVL